MMGLVEFAFFHSGNPQVRGGIVVISWIE